jgi:hypothetical protein
VQGRVEARQLREDGGEGVDHHRVELGPGPVGDLLAGLVEGDGLAVGAVGGHGVEGVGDREHPRPGRDGVAGQTGRVALAVPALVVAADHLHGAAQRLDAGHHLDPEQRVGPHHLPLAGVQRTGLVEHRLGDADLADVVEQEPVAQLLVGGQLGVDGLGQGDRVVVGPLEMGPGARVLGLDHEGQGLDHVQVRPAQPLQGPLELGRPGALGLVEVVDLVGEDHQLALGRLQLLQVAGARVHRLSRP